mmetsp:Transcript_30590/g.78007  ORF Transcript_30590/g.78007 Transcript_30590/m.78007 type:complete len:325 (-) Transcript_30590:92-1066(-)
MRVCSVCSLACRFLRRGLEATCDGSIAVSDGGRVGASESSESLLSFLAISTPLKRQPTKLPRWRTSVVERDSPCAVSATARETTSDMLGRSAGEARSIALSMDNTAVGTSSCMPGGSSTAPWPVTSGGLPAKIATPSTPSAHTSAACSSGAVACERPCSSGASRWCTGRNACSAPRLAPRRSWRQLSGSNPRSLGLSPASRSACSGRSCPCSKWWAWHCITVVAICANQLNPRLNSTAPSSATQSKSSQGQTSLYSWMVCDGPPPALRSMTRFARTIPCTAPGVSRSLGGMKVCGASAVMILTMPSGVSIWSTRAACSVFSVQL